jgi:hypothetical protein
MQGRTRDGAQVDVSAAGGPAVAKRVRRRAFAAGLRAVPLFVGGAARRRVYVAAGGMVDVAVRELGARLTQVEPVLGEPGLESASRAPEAERSGR